MTEYTLKIKISGPEPQELETKHLTHHEAALRFKRLSSLYPDYEVEAELVSPAGHTTILGTIWCLTYEWNYPLGDVQEYFHSEEAANNRAEELKQYPDGELTYLSVVLTSEVLEHDRPR